MGGFLSLLSVSSRFSKDGAVCCGSAKTEMNAWYVCKQEGETQVSESTTKQINYLLTPSSESV